MDNSLRLQLLRTKRELQTTINQIDNILFYNNIPSTQGNIDTRNQGSRQFIEGLMNIIGSRRQAEFNTSPRNSNSSYNTSHQNSNSAYNTSPLNSNSSYTSPQNRNSAYNTSPRSNIGNQNSLGNQTSYGNQPPYSNQTSYGNQNSLLNNYSSYSINTSSMPHILPDLVEVTLYSQNSNINTNPDWEDVQVAPNIQVLSNSSSIHLYSTLEDTYEQCTICRENFNSNSIVRKINNCSHIFHISCIDTWFENNITCPVCRIDLRDTGTSGTSVIPESNDNTIEEESEESEESEGMDESEIV